MDYLELIDCGTGGPRCDVTPLFADYSAFARLVDDLASRFERAPDCVAGIDALGFILGTALALHWRVGFAAIRKGGKLPGAADRETFVDYTGQHKELELRADLLPAGTRVILVDEWNETGAQARSAAALVERQGAIVAGIAAIHIDVNDNTQPILDRYNCQALQFEA
jgi:adenine phosphoribosyltransferase